MGAPEDVGVWEGKEDPGMSEMWGVVGRQSEMSGHWHGYV